MKMADIAVLLRSGPVRQADDLLRRWHRVSGCFKQNRPNFLGRKEQNRDQPKACARYRAADPVAARYKAFERVLHFELRRPTPDCSMVTRVQTPIRDGRNFGLIRKADSTKQLFIVRTRACASTMCPLRHVTKKQHSGSMMKLAESRATPTLRLLCGSTCFLI
jgi:hypothetical protein